MLPIHELAFNGEYDDVKKYVESGADIDIPDRVSCYTGANSLALYYSLLYMGCVLKESLVTNNVIVLFCRPE